MLKRGGLKHKSLDVKMVEEVTWMNIVLMKKKKKTIYLSITLFSKISVEM